MDGFFGLLGRYDSYGECLLAVLEQVVCGFRRWPASGWDLLQALNAVLQTAGWWRILPKAGEKGWKALIPVYNGYTYARAVRCPGLFYAQIAVILGYIVWILLLPFYLMTGSTTAFHALNILWYGVEIVDVVWMIVIAVRLARAFDKNRAFTAGLILCPSIFLCILGFGESVYTDPAFVPARPQEWRCASCGHVNRVSRLTCEQCGARTRIW